MFIHLFLDKGFHLTAAVRHLEISTRTAVDWNVFCCEVTVKFFENQEAIGGQDIEVEIDETAVARRKYERGRIMRTVWVFGGIERQSKKKFILPLLKDNEDDSEDDPEIVARSAENLLPMIEKYIKKGSIIYSDKWKAYDRISSLGYLHSSINHTENFVDGEIHTQNIERVWRDMKEWIKRPGMKRSHLKYYLGRYLFCTGEEQKALLHKFLFEAAAVYNPTGERMRVIQPEFHEEQEEDSD